MATHHHLIDSIRSFCLGADQTATPELADWAGRYAELCREANERLRRCADLLHRGLRGEALHLAEQMPPVLDVVAALDFSELPTWETTCASYALQRPQRLSMELASELNEAYAAHQPVEAVLRLYRVASMAPAPLPERLAVLRELIKLDAAAVSWQQDLEALEKARLLELRADLQRAVKQQDLHAVEGLEKEVAETNWVVPVPDDLRNTALHAHHEFRRREGVAKLKAMLPALNDAYGAMAFDEASPLVDRWAQVVHDYGAVVPPDLFEAVSPIESWVLQERDRRARQAEFEQGCDRLDHMLQDENTASPVLAAHLRTLQSIGLPVPGQLEQRYRSVMHHRELTVTRRKRRNMAVAGLAAAILIGGVAFGGVRVYHNQEARKIGTQILSLTAQDKLADAQQAYDQATKAGYDQYDAVATAFAGLKKAQDAEVQRVQKLDQELRRIAGEVQQKELKIDFSTADKLAKTGDEKLKVLDLKDARDALQREAAQAQLTLAQNRLAKLTGLVKDVEAALGKGDLDRVREEQRAIGASVLALLAMRNVPPEIRTSTEALKQRAAIIYQSVDRQTKAEEAVRGLIASSTSASALVAELAKAGEALGNPARAAVFSETAKLAPHWQAVEDWAGISSRIERAIKTNDLALLTKARDEAAAYLKTYPHSPLHGAVEAATKHATLAVQYADPKSDWRRLMAGVLESQPMSTWQQVRTKRGTFFVTGPNDVRSSVLNGQVQTLKLSFIIGETADPAQPARREVVIGVDELVDPKKTEPERSPQHELAIGLLRELDTTQLTNWETLPTRLANGILKSTDVDPGLRAILMQLVLESQDVEGLPRLAALGPVKESLLRIGAAESAWMNPVDERASVVRDRCKTWLEESKSVGEKFDELAALRQAAFDKSLLRLAGQGVLLADGSGLSIRSSSLPEDGTAYAVGTSSDGTPKWLSIASIRKGALTLEEAARQIADGSMVFIVPAAGGGK